jgi:high-affinity iron transporter
MMITVLITVLLVASGCSKRKWLATKGVQMPAGILTSSRALKNGRELFAENCASCHGSNGDGRGPRSAEMSPPPNDLTTPRWSDSDSAPKVYEAIRNGVAGTAMPSWKTLDDDQLWSLVAYVHSLGNP